MRSNGLTTGRRKEKRYRAIEDVFAVTKSNPGILGNILDISNKGLSFHCLANGEPSAETFEIDLFFSKSGYLTKKISCKKIFERTEHSQIPFSSLMMRRIGVNFVHLSPHQHKQVEHFINYLTNGQVNDRRCGQDRRTHKSEMLAPKHTKFSGNSFAKVEERRRSNDRRFPID